MSTEHAYHEVRRLGRELAAAQDRIVTLEHSLKLARVASTPWSDAMQRADDPTTTKPLGQVAKDTFDEGRRLRSIGYSDTELWNTVAAAVIAHHEATRQQVTTGSGPGVYITPEIPPEFHAALADMREGRTVPLDVALTAQFSPPAGGTEAPPSVGGDGEGEASGAENPTPPPPAWHECEYLADGGPCIYCHRTAYDMEREDFAARQAVSAGTPSFEAGARTEDVGGGGVPPAPATYGHCPNCGVMNVTTALCPNCQTDVRPTPPPPNQPEKEWEAKCSGPWQVAPPPPGEKPIKCNDWTKCPHPETTSETMSGEWWKCDKCGEKWFVDYEDTK